MDKRESWECENKRSWDRRWYRYERHIEVLHGLAPSIQTWFYVA